MLKIWLPLDESLENKGVSNLSTFSYNNFTQQTNGKIGKCYSGQGIYHLDEELIQNTWSLCAWVKSSAWSQYNDIILCKNTTASDNCQFYFSIINGATLNLGVNAGSGSVSVGYTFATNTWYHVTATYDGTKYALYINGEQKKTGTLSTTLKTGMNNLGINCRSTNAAGTAQTGDGGKWLNDVRIYDHCLSAAEVKEIAQGLVLHYKLDGFQGNFGNANILINTHFDTRYSQTTGWDTTKNGTLLANNWGGYNSGVANASTCYHAHLKLFQNEYVYEYIKDTENWLGISQGGLQTKLTAGKIYTFSCEQYSVTNTNYMYGGLYYFKTGASSASFHLGYIYCNTNRQQGKWQKFTYTFTAPSDGDYNKNMSWYCYGHNGGAGTFYLRHLKLEEGPVATPWCPADSELTIDRTHIQDSSGYEHNGWNSNATLTSSSGRYSYATACNGATVDNSSNILTGAQYFFGNLSLTTPSALTVAWWGKNDAYGRGGIFETTATTFTATTGMNGTDYNTTAIANWDITFRVYNGSSAFNFFSSFNKNGSWHHHSIVFDATKAYYYCDGILVTSGALTGTLPSFNGIRMGLGRAGGVYRQIKETVSDLRIYCTALSADDILALYHTGAKIDNLGNLHTFEFNENGSNKLTKTGVLKNYAIEPFLTLADGSKWQLILYHYVDGGNNLFTSSNATFCNDFGLYSRLAHINNFTYDSKYEFYVLQDDKQFRWTQTSQPTASSIAGLTTVNGYTNPVNGLAKASQSNTYIGYSSWWGACGCWTSYSTGGKTGIPGFGSHDANGICTTYLALYARVNNFNAKIANLNSYANNLIEL